MTTGLSHPPGRVKPTERQTPYNPFWIDLSAEKSFRLDPDWMMEGVVVNWLLKEDDSGGLTRLILGIEAIEVDVMERFLSKFFPDIKLTRKQIEDLLLLGHPTLACEIKGSETVKVVVANDGDVKDFVAKNYTGVLGGELKYRSGTWRINYNSGRYGDQHISDQTSKTLAKTATILCFKKYTGTDVKSA